MKDGLIQISAMTSSVPLSTFACSPLCMCVNKCVCEESVFIFLKPGSHGGGRWIPECYGQMKEERSTLIVGIGRAEEREGCGIVEKDIS